MASANSKVDNRTAAAVSGISSFMMCNSWVRAKMLRLSAIIVGMEAMRKMERAAPARNAPRLSKTV